MPDNVPVPASVLPPVVKTTALGNATPPRAMVGFGVPVATIWNDLLAPTLRVTVLPLRMFAAVIVVDGVVESEDEGSLVPLALVAVTRQEYKVPLLRGVTTMGDAVLLSETTSPDGRMPVHVAV